jgi:hypothetical protein
VITDEVEQNAQTVSMALLDKRVSRLEIAEEGIDPPVIGDVVAPVTHRGLEPRTDPHGVGPEGRDVTDVGRHTHDVAHAIPVTVGKTLDVDLIDHGVTPPLETDWTPHRHSDHPLSTPK